MPFFLASSSPIIQDLARMLHRLVIQKPKEMSGTLADSKLSLTGSGDYRSHISPLFG